MLEDHDAHIGTYADHLRTQLHANFCGRIEQVPGVLVRKARKNNAPEWRWIGKAGAGYPTHPLDAKHRRLQDERESELAKADRTCRLPNATRAATVAREAKGTDTRAQVLILAGQAGMRKKNGKPVPKRIVAAMIEAGWTISYSQVCRLIAATKLRITEMD